MRRIGYAVILIGILFGINGEAFGKENSSNSNNSTFILDIGFGQGKVLGNKQLEDKLNDTSFDNPENHLRYASITNSESRRNYEYYELANDKPTNFKTNSFRFGFEILIGKFGFGIEFQQVNVIADNYINQKLKPSLNTKNEAANQYSLIEMFAYRNHNTNVISFFRPMIDFSYHFLPLTESNFDPYIRISFIAPKSSISYSYGASTGLRYKIFETYAIFTEVFAMEHNINSDSLRINQGIYSLLTTFEDTRYISFREAGVRIGVSKLWF